MNKHRKENINLISCFTAIVKYAWLFICSVVLTACVTPHEYPKTSLCNKDDDYRQSAELTPQQGVQDNHQTDAETAQRQQLALLSNCHYFSKNMPYQRSLPRAHYAWVKQELGGETNTTASAELTAAVDTSSLNQQLVLSAGDQLMIKILNGEDFNSEVEVDSNGYIYLPYLPPIQAQGLDFALLKREIAHTLITEQLMLAHSIRISIMPIKWAPIEISVSGAVFESGQHLINRKSDTELKDDDRLHTGDQASERTISAALRSSGGIRPDADISRITLVRNGKKQVFDMRGIFDGRAVPTITLVAGDRIHVPSSKQFNDELVRPSQITAPGIRVFISNLTQPASSNSQSAVDTEATRFPYGTRLLNGAIAANCVGGAQSTNASRHVLLVTKNPLSNEMDVIERSLDKLIAQAWQSEFNPVLLPGDGIACYDSHITNIREIARSLTEVLIPANLLNWL